MSNLHGSFYIFPIATHNFYIASDNSFQIDKRLDNQLVIGYSVLLLDFKNSCLFIWKVTLSLLSLIYQKRNKMTYTNTNNLKAGSTFNYAGQSQTITKVTENDIVFVNEAGRKQRLSKPQFETSVSYYNFITDIKN